MQYVILIIDIIILLVIAFATYRGYRKGIIRTSILQGIKVVCLILLLLFSRSIASIIVNANIFELLDLGITEPNIISLVHNLITENLYDGSAAQYYEFGFDILVSDIIISLIRIVIVLVGMLLITIFIPILKGILLIAVPYLRRKSKGKVDKWVGAAIGFTCSVLVFIITVLPVYGMLEIADVAYTTLLENEVLDKEELSTNNQDDLFLETLDNSIILKASSNLGKSKDDIFGVGAKLLGAEFKIKMGKERINVVKEAEIIYVIVDKTITHVNNFENTEDYKQNIENIVNDVDTIVYYASKSNLVESLYDAGIVIASKELQKNETFSQIDINYERLQGIDVDQNLEELADFLKVALNIAKQLDFENANITEEILTNEAVLNNTDDLVKEAFEVVWVEEILGKVTIYYIDDLLIDLELNHLLGIIDIDYLKNDLSTDIASLADAYQLLNTCGVIDYFDNTGEEIIFTDENKVALDGAIDKIINLKLLQGSEKLFIQTVLAYTSMDNEMLQELANENIDWHQELLAFKEVLVEVIDLLITYDLNVDNLNEVLIQEDIAEEISYLVDKIFELQLADKYISGIVIEYLNEMLEGTAFEELGKLVTTEYLKEGFSSDIKVVINAYKTFKELGIMEHFDENNEYQLDLSINNNEAKLRSVLLELLNLELIDGSEEVFILQILEISGISKYLTITEDNFIGINYETENNRIVDIFINIVKIGIIAEKLNEDLIYSEDFLDVAVLLGDTFDSLYTCQITRDSSFALIDTILDIFEYDIEFTQAEKNLIIVNTGRAEFKVLGTVAKDGLELLNKSESGTLDIDNLDGANVTYLMKEASKGIIASKLMGQILNDMLGPDGLDINPIVDGNLKYDFTNPSVLSSQAVSVGEYIELHKAMNKIEHENIETTDIENIGNLIENLGGENIDNEIIEDILETIAPNNQDITIDESVNWSEEATLVEEVLTMYKDTEDKENFDLATNNELDEKVKNSDVATAILEYLGII